MTDYNKLAAELPAQQPQPGAAPVLYSVADTNPDEEAGLRALAKSTGIPAEALREKSQADEARRIDTVNRYDVLLRDNPKTSGFLQNPVAAAVAHDDVENMSAMERIISGMNDLSFRVRESKLRNKPMDYNDKLFAGGIKPLVTDQDFKDRADKMFASGLFPTRQEAADAVRRQIAGFVKPGESTMAPGKQGVATADAVGEWLSGVVTTPIGQFWRGVSQNVGDLMGLDSASAELARKQEREAAQSALIRPDFGSETGNAIASGVESTGQQLPAIAAGLASGGAAPTLAYIGAMTYGQSYSKYKGRGASTGMAMLGAGGEALVEVATEKLPMGETLRALESATGGRWKQAATSYLRSQLQEQQGEQAATFLQDAIDTAIANPNKTWSDYLAERPDAAYQTMVATLTQSALMAGAGGAARLAGRAGYVPPEQKQLQAESRAKLLEQINQGAAASKVLARDADTFQDFVKQAAEGGPVTDVYIDADVLNQSGLADQVIAASPAAAEQYREALATGRQVRIPIDEYAARIAPQEYAQQLLDDLRLQPKDMTRREAQTYAQSGAMQELEAAVAAIVGDKAQSDTFTASRDRVKQAVLDNLNALGRFTPQKNELDATLIAARSATRAAQLGMTPEEFFSKHVLGVVAQGQAGGEALNQFAGQGALTADLGALKVAQDRVKAGEDAETVRRETGWHTGTDGKWRFEISDADARLVPAIKSLDRGGYDAADIQEVTYRKNDDGTYSVALMHDGAKDSSGFVNLDSVPEEVVRAILPDDVFAAVQRGDGQRVFMVKDANQIKSAAGNAGTFGKTDNILFQPDGGPGPVKRGWFNPATNTIALLKNADLSTFLHESGHYFLETDISVARDLLRDNAAFGADTMKPGEQQILRDVSALLKWFGIEGDIVSQIDQWDRMDFEEKRGYHEQLAESFERYLLEGKAPSIELQTAFQSFRQWLFSVYKSVRDFLTRHPDAGQLNDEVRAVFDRMLATEEEIKLAEQARGMLPLFADAMNAGMTPSEFAEYQKLGTEATQAAIDQLQAQGMRDMKWLNNARSRMLKNLQKQAKSKRAEMRAAARMDVLREPVYQAWNVLTSKLTDEDKLAKKAKRSEAVDPAVDSLFEAIAKMGGLNKEAAVAQWGIDPKDKAESGLFGKPVLRAKDGGRTLDAMVEALTDEGYLAPDENGKGDIAELEEKFKAELRGDRQYSVIKDYEPEALAGQGEDLSGITAARIDRASLDDMEGLPQDVINKLESLGMTAKTGGIHPDVLSEILPGWTSGDELVRAIAAAQPLKDAIEARTDQWMLEQYADLATPEAVERAADAAIHNDARERFLAAEHKALVKASGDKSQRQLLLSAAREYARQLIGRQKIRDIRPSMYTAAEARAAKAAATSKDLSQKATEKRNQILSGMAAREAYRAQDDTDKGLRYLKKFDSPTIRKRINGDYVDQIEALLEKVDLRKRSLKDIDRRKSFGAFVRSQIEKGIVPAMSDGLLPPNLRAQYLAKVMERNEDGELIVRDDVEQAKILADYLDMAETRSYKDMTVDEFRGLIETIRQIEHLGRKKKSLLTARAGETYEQVRDKLVASVRAHSAKLPDRLNRTVPSARDEKLRGMRDFKISLRKIGMIMRLLDGNKDGGAMWDFFVRSANERGDWETEMIAQASEVLTKALRPVFSLKGGMRGKGVYFESLGRSLNREQRIGLALNVGNDGNLQRLLDGEGWSYADIRPVLQSLTKAEWDAVQAVWDHMDSYRPMIAAIEKRTVGAEPEWVQPVQFTVTTADGQTITLRGGYYPVKYDIEASARSEQLEDATDAKRAMNAAHGSDTTHRSFVKKRSEAVVGRPVELSLSAMYSGVQDVIHDLAWREWLIDASKMINSSTLDDAIRTKYGAETVRAIRQWISDIAAGTRKPRGVFDRAAAFLRKNVAASGLALNVMNAVQNVTGLVNSGERIGAKWLAVGQGEFLGDMKGAAAWVDEKSSFMANRAKTQFRDLNELRNIVENGDGIITKAKHHQFALITVTQRVVDVPTWIGAYRKAEAEGAVEMGADGSIDDSKAVAMADQAVIDAQGSGMTKDLSAVERGGELAKLFTAYYSYMNTTYNLVANRVAGARGGSARERGSATFHALMIMALPVALMAVIKAALTPGDDDDWEDPEKLAKKLAMEQMSFAMGLVPIAREFTPAIQPFLQDQTFGYQGPSGMRIVGDSAKFTQQAAQGDFDDGFRKAAVGLSGSLFGLPAAQINRTWTGIDALADDKTDNPAAVLFGYQDGK